MFSERSGEEFAVRAGNTTITWNTAARLGKAHLATTGVGLHTDNNEGECFRAKTADLILWCKDFTESNRKRPARDHDFLWRVHFQTQRVKQRPWGFLFYCSATSSQRQNGKRHFNLPAWHKPNPFVQKVERWIYRSQRTESCSETGATHQRVSMYVWRTHTPFPFIPRLCISALDTAAVPTATGALQSTNGSVMYLHVAFCGFHNIFFLWTFPRQQ